MSLLWNRYFAVLALLACFGFFFLVRSPASADKPPPADDQLVKAAAGIYRDLREVTLANGLRVVLAPIPESPTVSTLMAYKVGSADEELDQTGLSHYLEHLMFKGTAKLMPGDIDRLTQRNGGANNAYTAEDCTVYHFDFSSDRWETALEIEADRMRNLRVDEAHEFDKEKEVVVSELEQNEDEPWDLEYKAILPLLFGKKHPYGHPVIGEREHVRAADPEVILAYYHKWYHPNNAILVVCGGFDPDRALVRIKQLFEPIPKGALPERKQATAIEENRPLRHEMEAKFDVARLLVGFNVVAAEHPDSTVLDVIQTILSGGKTGRLYRRLVEGEELANEVSAYNSAGRYPGWFGVQVDLLDAGDRKQVEKLVAEELRRLREKPVDEAELKRVKQLLLADEIFGHESTHDLGDSIARALIVADLNYLRNYLPRVLAVTPREIQDVARRYLDPEKQVTLWSIPRDKGKAAAANRPVKRQPHARRPARGPQTQPSGREFALTNAQRVELPNGLVLLLYENRRLPIVAASALVRRTRLLEPEDKAGVAALVGSLLDAGTARHTSEEIAEHIENVGGILEMSSTGGKVKALAPHRERGLATLLECISEPTFPAEAFEREKERQLADIENAEDEPAQRALQVYREAVYGKHPLGRSNLGRKQIVEELTRGDCTAFHRRVFVPNNTLLAVVGDFDSRQVIDEVKRLTADWKRSELTKPNTPAVEKPVEGKQQIVTLPDAAQLHFYMGHPGIRRASPDYYKLLVMDHVLGTGPGFTDRLSAKLRDREGLGYTVSATITTSAGEEPGTFTCYINTAPENFNRVKRLFLAELRRIRDEKPEDEEVEDAKKYLLGNLAFRFTTNEQIAAQLLHIEEHGLGLTYLDDYRKGVAAVTADDVQAVARKYIDPDRLIVVAAGAIDANGRPLLVP